MVVEASVALALECSICAAVVPTREDVLDWFPPLALM